MTARPMTKDRQTKALKTLARLGVRVQKDFQSGKITAAERKRRVAAIRARRDRILKAGTKG